MSAIDKRLGPGEMVVHRSRLHWILFWKSLVIILVLGVLLRGHYAFPFLAALVLGWQMVVYQSSEVFVTNTRALLLKREFGGLREIDLPLAEIEEVKVTQDSFQARLDHGRIRLRGIVWASGFSAVVCNPQELERVIREEMAKLPDDLKASPKVERSEKSS